MTPANPGPDTSQAWTTATVQARPGPCGKGPARLTHMPSRCQNTQICSPQKTSAKARSATQNGGSARVFRAVLSEHVEEGWRRPA